MKTKVKGFCLEFGTRGGAHIDNLVIPSAKLAQKLAASLAMAFCNDPVAKAAQSDEWSLSTLIPRKTWQTATHFVALSRLDGIDRGAASAGLWRKSSLGDRETMSGNIISHPEPYM